MAGGPSPRVAIEPAPASPAAAMAAAPPHDVGLGYLRAATTVAVIAYHALIAYYPGPFPFSPHVMRMAFPVRDAVHFAGAKTLVAFFDSYFMSLMFLISGAFLWPSLTRQGAGAFVRGRALRLGLPFLFSAGLVGAIAYYPAYLLANPQGTLAGYFADWQRPGQWLGGPAWFIAVLLAFDAAAAALYLAWPRWGPTLGRLAQGAAERPLRFFALVAAASMLAYAPLALWLGPFSWWNVGPFWLQESRTLQYALYFAVGAGLGAYGLRRGLTAPGGRLQRWWWAWGLAAVAAFLISGNATRDAINHHYVQSLPLGALVAAAWALSCALTSFALMALFTRFARKRPLGESLSRNAYGMYLTHYALVTWLQYGLIRWAASPILKALIVIALATAGSWLLAMALRRIPLVARVI